MSDTTNSPDFREHYRAIREADRLRHGPGQLEFTRTTEIISRYLQFPCSVLDVGGGPGAYTEWLLSQRCHVDLIDPVPEHVESAAQLFANGGAKGSARVADACELPFNDAKHDAALLLGPLYHLTEREDRIRALREAGRVVKPGGYIFIAAISRYASLLDGFSRELVRDPAFVQIMSQDLVDGQHRNPTSNQNYFTTAFFHTASQLTEEIEAADLGFEALLAVEGPFWCLGNFDELWNDVSMRQLMLETLRRIESEPSLLGASAHWLAIARA